MIQSPPVERSNSSRSFYQISQCFVEFEDTIRNHLKETTRGFDENTVIFEKYQSITYPVMAFLSVPVLALLGLVLLAVYKFIVYPAFVSPLSKIPNAHWTAPVSPLWILWTRFSCHENRDLHAAHLKLGPVIRLAPNEISVNDVAGLRTVYAGGFEKGQWYSIFDNYG